MPKSSTTRPLARRHGAALWLISVILLLVSSNVGAESLRIAYTSIAVVYGPLWLTKEAGLFKKYNIEPEFVHITGDQCLQRRRRDRGGKSAGRRRGLARRQHRFAP